MRTIHKFPVSFGEAIIKLPVRAKFLHFADQAGQLTVWFELDSEVTSQMFRRYQVFPTGGVIPYGAGWLGTCQQGPFMWHLYELITGDLNEQ
jgi:hypothetical protein